MRSDPLSIVDVGQIQTQTPVVLSMLYLQCLALSDSKIGMQLLTKQAVPFCKFLRYLVPLSPVYFGVI